MKKLSFFLMAMLVSLTSFAAALGEGYSKVTDITTLAAGDKVVLYCDDAELGITGWDGTKTATAAATGWVEYVVEAADGGVLLKDGDNYVALTAKNSFHYTATGSVCKVTADGILYITFDSKDYLLYRNDNNGSPICRMYVDKSTDSRYKPFYVYEVTGEGGSTTPDPEPEPDPEPTPDPEGGETFETVTITFDADSDLGTAGTSQAPYAITKDGVTASVSSGVYGTYNGENHYRIYKNQTLTITSTVGNITSVEFTCTANDDAQYGPGCLTANAGSYTYSGATGTWTGSASEVVFTASAAQVRATQIVVTVKKAVVDPTLPVYTIEATADEAMGSVLGAGEYTQGQTVSLTATPKSGYEFSKWSNGSTDNPLVFTASENVSITAIFVAQTPITIAEALQLVDGATGVLNEFIVTYVNGSNIYIEDESGYALVYKSSYGLKAGDAVNGMAFKKSTYNDIAQFTPTSAYADLTIVAGEAPAVTEITSAPTVADNCLVKLMNVSLAGDLAVKTITVATCADESTINIYSTIAFTVEEGKTYNILGGVTQYKGVIQIQAYEVEEYVAPVTYYNIYLTAAPSEGGEVEGEGEFEAGEQVTVSALANEGYEFVNWTEGEEVVSTNANYTFEVTAERDLVANFKEVVAEPEYDMEITCTNLKTVSEGNMTHFLGTSADGMEIDLIVFGFNGAGTYEGVEGSIYADGTILFTGTAEYAASTIEGTETNVLTAELALANGMTVKVTMYNLNAGGTDEPGTPGETITVEMYDATFTVEDGVFYIEAEDDNHSIFLYIDPWDGYGDYEAYTVMGFVDDVEVANLNEGASVEKEGLVTTLYVVLTDGTNTYNVMVSGMAPAWEGGDDEPVEPNDTITITANNLTASVLYEGVLLLKANANDADKTAIFLSLVGGDTKGYGEYGYTETETGIWPDVENASYGDVNLTLSEDVVAKYYQEGGVDVFEGTFLGDDNNLYILVLRSEDPTVGLENLDTTVAPVKAIINGQLIIIKNGVQYNAQGAIVK